MKEFLKMTGATIVGLILFSVLIGILGIMSLVGMIASDEATKKVKSNSVLVVNLSGVMSERAEGTLLSRIQGGNDNAIGLDNMLNAIEKATENDDIKGIYIEAGMFAADSYASLQAVRRALSDFKKTGKWIVAYGDSYTQSTYYLASVADKVYINPSGQIDWHGLSAQPYYLKNLMNKFGVKMQLAKVGTYKSAPETFTADKMSEPNREQITQMLTGVWKQMTNEVAASRKITSEQLNSYADEMYSLKPTEQYIKAKLADKMLYTDQVKTEIKKLLKLDDDDDINQISVSDMQNVKSKRQKGEEIAVYYAYGSIVDGAQGMMEQGHVIDAQVVCKDLERLMNDDDVKAVVLRINSGGGSAYASEQMWHSIELLKAKKPVVVSMGGMAASGGYYMSCNSNWIVAEPTTITGSIGIFGMFPDVSGLLTEKLGVTFDEVKTNKNSTFGTMARPFNAEEMQYLEAYIDHGYDLFRKRVADGRKMKVEDVEKIAQGRVWLATDAKKIKLVDQLGSLKDAVKKAAELAKLDKYKTHNYPAAPTFFEQLSMSNNGGNYLDEHLKTTLGDLYQPLLLLKNINRQNAIQARIPFYINMQ